MPLALSWFANKERTVEDGSRCQPVAGRTDRWHFDPTAFNRVQARQRPAPMLS
jgi:hypothetical protein